MDNDRNAGSAKDFAGKVESAVGSMAGPRPRASPAKPQRRCAMVRKPWRKRLRTIRSALYWSPSASALRWRC
jgi:hypothetical protein